MKRAVLQSPLVCGLHSWTILPKLDFFASLEPDLVIHYNGINDFKLLPAHLESNFINPDYRGAQPAGCLRVPPGPGWRSSAEDRAPGADDNGSGSAAVLTAAKIFSQYRFERTIHYVLFTGEEQRDLGSQEYVAQAVVGGSNIVAVIAPDMIGYASAALQPPTCRLTLPPPPDLGLQDPVGAEIAQMFTAGSDIEAMFTNVVAAYGLSNTISCSFTKSL